MSFRAQEILANALQLPVQERAELAGRLLQSLDTQVDTDAVAGWDAEVLRRVNELDQGVVQPVPWDEARRTISGQGNGPHSV
jgi:putative addiction module component (TIGR02574 family)